MTFYEFIIDYGVGGILLLCGSPQVWFLQKYISLDYYIRLCNYPDASYSSIKRYLRFFRKLY